jgi:SHS2 domain-containing protein
VLTPVPFRFLPDVALADVAFEVTSTSVSGLFEGAAAALTEVMVDRRTLARRRTVTLHLDAEDLDRLLYDFLTELIVRKDVDLLLVKQAKVRLDRSGRKLEAKLVGEKIDRKKHGLRNDVKAVTMHMFGISREGKGWKATVVLDI